MEFCRMKMNCDKNWVYFFSSIQQMKKYSTAKVDVAGQKS
jgi:hypothetical protein